MLRCRIVHIDHVEGIVYFFPSTRLSVLAFDLLLRDSQFPSRADGISRVSIRLGDATGE